MIHLAAATAPLQAAVSRADRLVSSRTEPVVIAAENEMLAVAAGGVSASMTATVYAPGRAAVGLRALATVLSGLPEPVTELRIEGQRLAVRTPSARFALPLIGTLPPTGPEVPVLGVAAGLRDVAAVVAAATAKDGLPLFTAVRIRSKGERLILSATDRFRAVVAAVAWEPRSPEPVDVLAPASTLTAAVRYADRTVPIRAGAGWFGVDWAGGGMVMPQLALPFPDAQLETLLRTDPVAVVEVDAARLQGAVDRVRPFAADGIRLELSDGAVAVCGAGELGEARETVKASTTGDHVATRYQPRYLADAVRAYPAGVLRVEVQQGIRPTVFTAGDLRYLVVPLRTP